MLPQVGISGRDAGAQEREDRLEQDRRGADIGALHDQRRQGVGQHVADQDQGQPRADRDRRLHIGLLADRQHDRAHQPHHAGDLGDHDRDDHGHHAAAPQADQADREQDRRDRHQAVHHPHHHAVEPADVAGQHADHEADRDAEHGDGQAHHQGDPGAVDHPAVDVAAERIGAHPMHPFRLAAVRQVDLADSTRGQVAIGRADRRRVQGAEPGRQQRHQHHQQQHGAAEQDAGLAQQPLPHALAARAAGLGQGFGAGGAQ